MKMKGPTMWVYSALNTHHLGQIIWKTQKWNCELKLEMMKNFTARQVLRSIFQGYGNYWKSEQLLTNSTYEPDLLYASLTYFIFGSLFTSKKRRPTLGKKQA